MPPRTKQKEGSTNDRKSTRVRTLSKAMRHVDEETRREHKNLRLQALEADNYVEENAADGDESDFDDIEVCNVLTVHLK